MPIATPPVGARVYQLHEVLAVLCRSYRVGPVSSRTQPSSVQFSQGFGLCQRWRAAHGDGIAGSACSADIRRSSASSVPSAAKERPRIHLPNRSLMPAAAGTICALTRANAAAAAA
jgi:hypothetical protein